MEIRYEIGAPRVSRRRPSFFRHFFLRWSSTVILLVILIAFIGQLVAKAVLGPAAYCTRGDYGTFLYYLMPSRATVLARPWTLITSIFLHGGFLHLFFNGIVLFFFGPALEMRIGRRKFLYVFFGAGILAGAAQLLVIPPDLVVLGASGAILGVLGTLTVLAPRLPVLLFFFIPMPLWVLTLGIGALSAILAPTTYGGISHMAHVTGLVVGLICGYKFKGEEERRYRRVFQRFFGI